MIYEKLSNRNLTNVNPANIDYSEKPDDCEIVNTTFYQELPHGADICHIEIFYGNLDGARFVNCNLDNVKPPKNAELVNCSNRLISCQLDGFDWVLDPVTKLPAEPVDKKMFLACGWSIDPADIQER